MTKGDKFTEFYEVTSSVYKGFIEVFKDMNPLHTDSNFAQAKGFREAVIHGNILNGFVSHFIGEKLPLKNVIIHTQRIKYCSPVYLNDKLVFEAEIIDFSATVNLYDFKFHFKNEEGKKAAMGQFQIGLLT